MGIKRSLLIFVAALTAIQVGFATVPAITTAVNQSAQAQNKGTAVKDNYIVVLRADLVTANSVTNIADELTKPFNGKVKHKYTKALRGFSVQLPDQAAKALANNPLVAYVEQDRLVRAHGAQTNPTWGLDRIDQRALPLNSNYTYPNTANNVTAYVIDSGLRTSHAAFEGRAVNGYDFIDNDAVANDCNGHGTHVAGTIGSATYGVAKKVKLVGIRVLGCDGTGMYSTIIAGVDWVTNNASGPSVANMSLGGSASSAFDNAVANSIASGITYALSSGNENTNACNMSPARVASAITVGNTTNTDARNQDSNYGSCVDIHAPGTNILSTTASSDTSTGRMTGTSMASPHVAGAAALLLSANPSLTPQLIRDELLKEATSNVIANVASSPNKLLHIVQSGTTLPPVNSCGPFTNSGDVTIPDLGSIRGYINVTDCLRQASRTAQVNVAIKHTFRGDLKVYIVAADGTRYKLKDANPNDGADNIQATYTVDLSAHPANGGWKLRVDDIAANDTGYLDSWTLTL